MTLDFLLFSVFYFFVFLGAEYLGKYLGIWLRETIDNQEKKENG